MTYLLFEIKLRWTQTCNIFIKTYKNSMKTKWPTTKVCLLESFTPSIMSTVRIFKELMNVLRRWSQHWSPRMNSCLTISISLLFKRNIWIISYQVVSLMTLQKGQLGINASFHLGLRARARSWVGTKLRECEIEIREVGGSTFCHARPPRS